MGGTTYCSTRGGERGLSFEEVVLGGLAKDKGLYLPEEIPQMSMDLRGLSFSDLAFRVISKFISTDDIPAYALKDIVDRSFASFRVPEVVPCVKKKHFWVMELFHGPTFAFKDVALQFLGNVFEFFLKRGNMQTVITILGATSGDTGSAAIHGLRGKENVNCFILYPKGKVTVIQEKQMTSILDENVQCISLATDFDGCQATVKAAFADAQFRDAVKLGAVNSINWARVLAQITYYYYSWLRVTDASNSAYLPKVSFVVPTGNFGDILAGFFAKQMGLPVEKLLVATNQNDVLHRFFQTGVYRKDPAVVTMAPSMDISVSSNFERYLFYLAGADADTCREWMDTFENTGTLVVSATQLAAAKRDFASSCCSEVQIVQNMVRCWREESYLLCPHTATAAHAIHQLGMESSSTVCLATAHPAKFQAAVDATMEQCGSVQPARPPQLEALFAMSTRSTELPVGLANVQAFMRQTLASRTPASVLGGALRALGLVYVGNAADRVPYLCTTLVLATAATAVHVLRSRR